MSFSKIIVMMEVPWSPEARIEVFFDPTEDIQLGEFSWRKNITDYFEADGSMTQSSIDLFNMVYPGVQEVAGMVKYLISLQKYYPTFHLAISLDAFLSIAE